MRRGLGTLPFSASNESAWQWAWGTSSHRCKKIRWTRSAENRKYLLVSRAHENMKFLQTKCTSFVYSGAHDMQRVSLIILTTLTHVSYAPRGPRSCEWERVDWGTRIWHSATVGEGNTKRRNGLKIGKIRVVDGNFEQEKFEFKAYLNVVDQSEKPGKSL